MENRHEVLIAFRCFTTRDVHLAFFSRELREPYKRHEVELIINNAEEDNDSNNMLQILPAIINNTATHDHSSGGHKNATD